jgi:hypothetical protein
MHKKQPHLVEVGDHVAIDVGVYLATEAKLLVIMYMEAAYENYVIE